MAGLGPATHDFLTLKQTYSHLANPGHQTRERVGLTARWYYAPLGTCLLISVVLSLVLWLLNQ
jgi:hypothetical protein